MGGGSLLRYRWLPLFISPSQIPQRLFAHGSFPLVGFLLIFTDYENSFFNMLLSLCIHMEAAAVAALRAQRHPVPSNTAAADGASVIPGANLF